MRINWSCLSACLTSPDADRNYFSQYIHGYGTIRRRCPIGTLYNDRECGCIDLAPVTSICKYGWVVLHINELYDQPRENDLMLLIIWLGEFGWRMIHTKQEWDEILTVSAHPVALLMTFI